MVKLIKAKYVCGREIECYPLAKFLEEISEEKKVEHKSFFRKWTTTEYYRVDKMSYLVYIPSDDVIDTIYVEDLMGSIDEVSKSWVKANNYTSTLSDEYDNEEYLVRSFFGEQFILDHNDFMCLYEEGEDEECLEILRKEKPELFSL